MICLCFSLRKKWPTKLHSESLSTQKIEQALRGPQLFPLKHLHMRVERGQNSNLGIFESNESAAKRRFLPLIKINDLRLNRLQGCNAIQAGIRDPEGYAYKHHSLAHVVQMALARPLD